MPRTIVLAMTGLAIMTAVANAAQKHKAPAQDAIGIAKCARAEEKLALTALTDDPPGLDKKAMQEKATRELAVLAVKEREGARKCLTEDQVYDLGWFSYFQDEAGVLADCSLFATPALSKHPEDDGETDLLTVASHWAEIPDDAHRKEHPYFAGQDAAKDKYQDAAEAHRYDAMCKDILAGFGPKGSKFSGLVSRTKIALDPGDFADAASPSKNELRFLALYREFQGFRDNENFKQCGFGACGYPKWLADIQALWNDDVAFTRSHMLTNDHFTDTNSRCDGTLSADLMNLGDDWINVSGTPRSPEDRHALKQLDTKVSACADLIETAAKKSKK